MSLVDNIKEFAIKSLGGTTTSPDELEKAYSPRGLLDFSGSNSANMEQGASTDVSFSTLYRIYRTETWVRACVDIIKRGIIAPGLKVDQIFDEAGDSNEEYLRHFLAYPNPEDSIEDIIGDIATDLLIYGNAYLEMVTDRYGLRVKEIWNLDATTMKVKHDEHGITLGYVQEAGGKKVEFSTDEIIHFKLTSKGATVYGLSPLETLVRTIDTDLKAAIYMAKYFENFGAPKALFKFKNATPEQVRRNKLFLATQVSGVENAHKNLILEGDVEYEPLSTDLKDTKALEVRRFLRDEIFAVYGVPPSKVAIIESGNIGGGSGDSQDKTFKLETIVPLQEKISKKLNHRLVRGAMGIFDYEIAFGEVLDVDRLEESKIYEVYIKNGVMLPEEVREELGYEPLDDAKRKYGYPTREEEEARKLEMAQAIQGKGDTGKDNGKGKGDTGQGEKASFKEDEKDKEKKLEPVLAIKKGLDIDFEDLEPQAKRLNRVISTFVNQKVSEVVNRLEEQDARNN